MVFDDELQGSELDELQQLAARFLGDPSEPGTPSIERPKVHSDDFDIVHVAGDADR